jgi:hypothetical protein
LEECLQICLLDLLGTWLDGKEEMVGQEDCTGFRNERVGGKAKADRTVGLFFFPMPTRLCIESWNPLGFQ